MEDQIQIRSLDPDERKKMQIDQWPIWEKETSRFDWFYESTEQCLILEGEIEVETDKGKVQIKPGDFVTFKKGLRCVWDVQKPVRKHYRFL